MHRARLWVGGLVVVALLAATAAEAAGKRRRRRRPGSSSPPASEPADNQESSSSSSSSPQAAPSRSSGSGGGNLDQQIRKKRADIRGLRRSLAGAVDRAALSGTKLYVGSGSVPSGAAVSWSSVHGGKKLSGTIKATSSGNKVDAEVSAKKAR